MTGCSWDVYEFAPFGGSPLSAIGGGAGQVSIWPEPARYDSFVTPADFHSLPYEEPAPAISTPLPTPVAFRPGPAALQSIADRYADPRIRDVRDKVALIGYDLDQTWARPGGVVVVTLFWQALEVVNLPYKVFVHLDGPAVALDLRKGAEPESWAQADDLPACGTRPTQGWRVGETVADRHMIESSSDVPAGEYVLRVGMYEPQTAQRLDLLDAMGAPQGTSLDLARVRVPVVE